MGFLQTVAQQFGQIWKALSPGHRVLIVLLVLACGGLIAVAVNWAGRTDYEILYAGLAPEDVQAISAALRDAGIKGRIADGGSAVLVPVGRVHEARMVAAEKGLPGKARSGFEAFREPKIGMTPRAEQINYLNALQTELATTIMALDSVKYARVHLVLPERTVFRDEQRRPSASVLVVPARGQELSASQVAGIVNLVANAVEGLRPDQVTVTDGAGTVLSGAGAGGANVLAADQFAYRRKVENEMSRSVEAMLAGVLGPGRCQVRVSAELEFKDQRTTLREYDPEKRVLVSESIESRKSDGGGSSAGGVAGAGSAVPSAATSRAPAGGAGSDKSENIRTQYMVGETVREIVDRGATIRRLTIAALVELPRPAPAEGAEAPTGAAAPLTLADVEQVSRDAVGFDASRGDSLKIVETVFQRPAPPGSAEAASFAWAADAGRYFSVGVLGLGLLMLARRILRGLRAAGPADAPAAEIVGPNGAALSGPPVSQEELLRREIARFVTGNPDVASRMLEGWVEGEE